MLKTKSLQCAILGLLFYLAQSILFGLLVGTFSIEDNISQYISYILVVFGIVLLIRNRIRASYFGFCPIKSNRKPHFYFPLLLIPIINLFYLLLPERMMGQGILICIVSGFYIGFIEELIFRGFLFRAIEERKNSKWAIIITSIAFGLFHLVNLGSLSLEFIVLQVIYATAVGVSLSIIFHITQSLWPCIIIHALTDITSFLFAESMKFEIECVGVVIIILVAIFYSFLFRKHKKTIKFSK